MATRSGPRPRCSRESHRSRSVSANALLSTRCSRVVGNQDTLRFVGRRQDLLLDDSGAEAVGSAAGRVLDLRVEGYQARAVLLHNAGAPSPGACCVHRLSRQGTSAVVLVSARMGAPPGIACAGSGPGACGCVRSPCCEAMDYSVSFFRLT